ncbi:unnamed protein product, partial [Amoebophrya sp. A25]|eukprot:GSA25T00022707001.1
MSAPERGSHLHSTPRGASLQSTIDGGLSPPVATGNERSSDEEVPSTRTKKTGNTSTYKNSTSLEILLARLNGLLFPPQEGRRDESSYRDFRKRNAQQWSSLVEPQLRECFDMLRDRFNIPISALVLDPDVRECYVWPDFISQYHKENEDVLDDHEKQQEQLEPVHKHVVVQHVVYVKEKQQLHQLKHDEHPIIFTETYCWQVCRFLQLPNLWVYLAELWLLDDESCLESARKLLHDYGFGINDTVPTCFTRLQPKCSDVDTMAWVRKPSLKELLSEADAKRKEELDATRTGKHRTIARSGDGRPVLDLRTADGDEVDDHRTRPEVEDPKLDPVGVDDPTPAPTSNGDQTPAHGDEPDHLEVEDDSTAAAIQADDDPMFL